MMKTTLSAALVLLTALTFSLSAYANSEKVIASLDDENVTLQTLTNYVETVAGNNYKPWLRDKDGLRKLSDFFINRTLLLEYARQTVAQDNTIVTNHSARRVDADAMYLSSLLQREIQDKVHITQEDLRTYMQGKESSSEKLATQEMESNQKTALMDALVDKLRAGHDIKYFN